MRILWCCWAFLFISLVQVGGPPGSYTATKATLGYWLLGSFLEILKNEIHRSHGVSFRAVYYRLVGGLLRREWGEESSYTVGESSQEIRYHLAAGLGTLKKTMAGVGMGCGEGDKTRSLPQGVWVPPLSLGPIVTASRKRPRERKPECSSGLLASNKNILKTDGSSLRPIMINTMVNNLGREGFIWIILVGHSPPLRKSG